jgi:retinol dehydrogenase 14
MVTGATSGIGFEVARQVAAQRDRRILVGSDEARLAVAADAARHAGADAVQTCRCDFASLAEVRVLAETIRADYERVDVLVNNAGTAFEAHTTSVDGIEATFAVNHLAGFLLTESLKDLLVASTPTRVVFTASKSHYWGRLDLDDIAMRTGYATMAAYSRSKLANVLYARTLARELGHTGVTVNAVDPGSVRTAIWDNVPRVPRPVLAIVKRAFMGTPAEGAAAIAYLATSADVDGVTGEYFDGRRSRRPARLALDDGLAQRLRAVSAELVGLPD